MVVAETVAARQGRRRTGRGRLRAAAGCVTDHPPTPPTPDAPRLREENASNIVHRWRGRRRGARPRPHSRSAAHVVRLETWIQRVAGVADGAARRDRRLRAGHRSLHPLCRQRRRRWRAERAISSIVLGVPRDRVRVVMRDVGGNFGTRGTFFPEYALVAWAAQRVGRPVKWTSDRSEGFLSDYQGRDLAVEAELALDKDGNFLAMRGSNISNLGAHTGDFSPLQRASSIMSSIYRMPAAHFRAPRRAQPTPRRPRPYRSAGRPEVDVS